MAAESQHRPPGSREPTFAEKRRGDFWINAVIGIIGSTIFSAVGGAIGAMVAED